MKCFRLNKISSTAKSHAEIYGSFATIVTRKSKELGSNPAGSDVCHRSYTYTMLVTVQRPGVCSAVYGNVYYKKNLDVIR